MNSIFSGALGSLYLPAARALNFNFNKFSFSQQFMTLLASNIAKHVNLQ